MANPGSVGAKFVSVNLNKSYGQSSHHHPPYSSSSYGPGGSNRVRTGGHVGGGGSGMVVLSRPRSSQKAGQKLSVPPPLNLPSLRKEHERVDLSGPGGGSVNVSGSGSGSRPNSSGMGWTKPGTVALQEKEGSGVDTRVVHGIDQSVHTVDGVTRGSSVYTPPSASVGPAGPHVSSAAYQPAAQKAMVLRGEDFPSLKAALPVTPGPSQKQKDNMQQKQKHVVGEELSDEQRDSSLLSSLVHMRPQGQTSIHNVRSSFGENGIEDHHGLGKSNMAPRQARKQEDYFPGPLPLVRLNPRFDWADDERDTGHGFADRGREHGFPKTEAYWDDDMPRTSVLPHRPPNNLYERWGQRDNETRKVFPSEVPKMDPYHRDAVRTPSREVNSWRPSPLAKDGNNTQEAVNERNAAAARPISLSREPEKENKYKPPLFGDNVRDVGVAAFGKREMGYGQERRQQWNHSLESFNNQGSDRNTRGRYGNEQSNRSSRGESFQNNSISKSSISSGGKSVYMKDSTPNLGRDNRAFSRNERSYLEDPFVKDFGATAFDEKDPFTGGLVGVIKRKKDVVKQADFHDPVRESFEAELERVQKLQEQERQRIVEEQERALEQARREEEERMRLIREEEERRRMLEEEAREAAWRAEQEQLEAIHRAEEQKIAREEERQRTMMEEERRKQAAKQKLLELEARIAKRRAEVSNGDTYADERISDERVSAMVKEKNVSRAATDLDNWEDSERMVERITTSASSDSSGPNRLFEIGSRPHYTSRESSSSGLLDRGKHVSSWRRDVFETGIGSSFLIQDQDNGHHSPRRDSSVGGRAFPRKEFYGGGGYMSSRPYFKGGTQEPQIDDFSSLSGHGDPYNRNIDIDSEFRGNFAEKYGDVGWGQGHSRGTRSPYSEQMCPNSESDELYSYGRSRYSMRQPRVLPPPSLASMHKTSFRGENEHPGGSSTFIDNDSHYNHSARNESSTGYYSGHQETLEPSEIVNVHGETTTISEDQKLDKDSTPRCDSQSSLSVSSPPSSPTHLSHDDLDESGDSAVVISSVTEGKEMPLSGSETVVVIAEPGKDTLMTALSSISAGDDEEWSLENNDELQEQEEYYEDEDGYQEEDEVREGDDENIDLTQEFEGLHLKEEVSSSLLMDNLVLGFDEGVEMGIPSDEFDRNLRNEENAFRVPEVSIGIINDQRPVDGLRVQEPERGIQDYVAQPTENPQTSLASDRLDTIGGFSTSGGSTPLAVSSSVNMGLHSSGQTSMSTVPAGLGQPDLPIKLQFGLFSGPSLIPSPVPAIQIGSIQMPLHLHSAVGGPPLTRIHPSQPPLFQFGQLRYTSPISSGILPMAAQPMSFVQPNVQTHYNLNQNLGGHLSVQPSQEACSHNLTKDVVPPLYVDDKSRAENSLTGENKVVAESISQIDKGHQETILKNYVQSSNENGLEGQLQSGPASSQPVSSGKDSGIRERRFSYSARNSSSRSSTSAVSEASRPDYSGYQRRPRRPIQRTEFRVRENVDRKQSSEPSYSNSTIDDKLNNNGRGVGIFLQNVSKKSGVSNKPVKQRVESDSSFAGPVSSSENYSERKGDKGIGKEAIANSDSISLSGEGNLKRNISPEEDVDAPLQSGIVRVFKQPGIEAPSDEDDFIQVRSKRQMLNDRREQREKEIKAKSRLTKAPWRPRSTPQSASVSSGSIKISASLGGEEPNVHSDFVVSEGRGGVKNLEASTVFTAIVSQPLAPIGTPSVNTDMQADKRSTIKSLPTGSVSVMSSGGKNLGPGQMFVTKNKVLDNVHTSLGSWDNARINQQVMALTQTQLDEAMKPVRFDAHVASIGDHTSSVNEPIIPSPSSIVTKDKLFPSTASPINSLLAGEKIQFGAVTSPTVLPPSSRAVSHGIGAPGSGRADIQILHSLSPAESERTLFFEKDKHSNDSCVHLEDCEAAAEAEAEAAASAVAVAAIISDEIVGTNGLGACAVPVSDTKNFGDADIDGITGGGLSGGQQQLASQSRGEESLSVALPADLSIENPPISLWPPLPSPQNSSNQMIPHFPPGQPSHFPYFDMNPMLGGPIFAFGPHDESSGTSQSLSQKSTPSSSGPLAAWQQCHSGVDSFYGPPAGFAGPFISPPGGIPGVQGPPHMVVYNHFAPVGGQFGQVGLSYMGTTYIPSGKQPDWKHNPTSSAVGIGEVDMNKSMNMVSALRNSPNMPSPVPHLAPGSSILPMPSPLAMFDMSPFQSAPDVSVQARWSHVPASPMHPIPMSLPLQNQAEGVLPPQFSHGHPVDQPLTANRFSESRTSTPPDSSRSFRDELGLVDPSSSAGGSSTQSTVNKNSSGSTMVDSGNTGIIQNSCTGPSTNVFRNQTTTQQKKPAAQPNAHSMGYNYQRGGGGGDWSHRRMRFNGRNQSLDGEKGFPSSKVKQIYVAKQTPSGNPTEG